jgi:hypothetical protein
MDFLKRMFITIWYKYICAKQKFIKLVKKIKACDQLLNVVYVKKNDIDVTESFFSPDRCDDNDKIKLCFEFKGVKYICKYLFSSPIRFPMYSFEEMTTVANPKIVYASINGIDVLQVIKQYAGPLHNFFSDKGSSICLSDIDELNTSETDDLFILYHNGGEKKFGLTDLLT